MHGGHKMSFWNKLLGKSKDISEPIEPYITVVKLHIPNSNDPSVGYFELDWNTQFVDELKKSGYTGTTEEDIVNQWFTELCKGIVDDSENW